MAGMAGDGWLPGSVGLGRWPAEGTPSRDGDRSTRCMHVCRELAELVGRPTGGAIEPGGVTQATYCRFGLYEHAADVWSSHRQCWHRGISFARPVNASLYSRALGVNQFKSFRASMSRRN